MHRANAIIAKLAIIAVLSLGFSGLTATPAAAYGNDAVYQIMFSFNCDSPTAAACQVGPNNPFGPGGFWGWIELDSTTHPGATTGGDADLVVTGCDHGRTSAPHGGADHFNLDGTWFYAGGLLFISAGPIGTLVVPAAPGHYSMHPAPAIANEVQITLIPGR